MGLLEIFKCHWISVIPKFSYRGILHTFLNLSQYGNPGNIKFSVILREVPDIGIIIWGLKTFVNCCQVLIPKFRANFSYQASFPSFSKVITILEFWTYSKAYIWHYSRYRNYWNIQVSLNSCHSKVLTQMFPSYFSKLITIWESWKYSILSYFLSCQVLIQRIGCTLRELWERIYMYARCGNFGKKMYMFVRNLNFPYV